MRVAKAVELSAGEDRQLRILAKRKRVEARVALRANIVLMASKGLTDLAIGTALNVDRRMAARWRTRYLAAGVPGILSDAPRPGRTPRIDARQMQEVVRVTLQERPANATHWSTRTLARRMCISEASVRRIWHRHGLKPHRVRTFKLSKDKCFVEKLEAIVGLYLNPPERAIVLCCDEKSQIQALNRTQPGLPMKRGRCKTMTHDYKRHGTTTLFAALNTLTGAVLGTCMARHRHQEWLKFLRLIDRNTPKHKELHLIADNYATHKHEAVQAWLAKHPRFHMHFTPTSSSWLNMVERFFRDISENRLRRESFTSVPELEQTIYGYLDAHNLSPKPFVWTAKASDILAKVTRAREAAFKYQSV